jgi:AcrR family transcriptional regulator
MTDTALTPARILEAAEEVLRRFGPAKATVVDVARALRVSHGSVYRHFASKATLREAVAERWLDRAHALLPAVTAADTPAPQRLRDWLDALFATKRKKALDDPELFATYTVLVAESSAVVAAHIDGLVGQLARIIGDGVAAGEFAVADVDVAARAVFDATARFHDPAYAAEWGRPGIEAAHDAVCSLLLAGLRASPRLD